MSNFKVHYAGIRKTQKKSEVPTDFQNPSSNPPQQKSQNANNPPSSNSKPQSPGKEGDSDFLGIYKTNFHSENLDYIDLLLKNKASNGKDVSEGAGKKKARPRAKSNISEVVNNQPQVHPHSPQVNRKIPEIKTSNIQLFDENDKPASMRPDEDDGIFPITPPVEKKKKEEMEQDEDNFYNGNDTHRNLRGTQTKNEGKLFEQYFNEGVVRRSMSLEDLRVDKKMFNKDHNKSTFHNYGEIGSYSVESVQQDSKQSNTGPSKDDFMANLANYIDYFNKSDNVSYRSMKAGQYFHGNSGKSHRAVQRELEAASHEMRMMKLQMEKMKRKMNELASMNKALTKELKIVSLREEEQQQILLKMQEKTIYLAQKNKKYKTERAQVQELLRQERIENEKNMFSMRQVLANSINIALDQKVAGPYGKEKHSHLKSVLADNLASKKDREKMHKYNFQKDKKRTNGTSEAFASIFETGNHMRSREARMSPKKEGSVMFSQKQASVSSHEEEEGEGDFGDRYSNSNEFENSYGGEEFRSQDLYQDSYLQDLAKDNQIKMIQEKLAELMNSEDMAFNGQGTGHKSTTTKTSRSKQPQQQHSKKSSNIPSYYLSKATNRDRQGNIGKQSHLGKYNPQDQYSRAVHGGYGEAPSGNDMTDRSFSLHNSE